MFIFGLDAARNSPGYDEGELSKVGFLPPLLLFLCPLRILLGPAFSLLALSLKINFDGTISHAVFFIVVKFFSDSFTEQIRETPLRYIATHCQLISPVRIHQSQSWCRDRLSGTSQLLGRSSASSRRRGAGTPSESSKSSASVGQFLSYFNPSQYVQNNKTKVKHNPAIPLCHFDV